MPTAQNGWPASGDKKVIGVDANFAVAGVKFPGGVKAGDASVVLGYVAQQFHNRVEKLVQGWCWGYSFREIRGTSTQLSNHAAAAAIDVNAPKHPLGKRGTFNAAQVREINAIVNECGGVVRWGGVYSRPDEMHFELVGSTAQVAAVARKLRGGIGAPPPPASSDTVLQRGSTGDKVKQLQRVLNAWYPFLHLAVDGIYGAGTEAGVKELQRRAGLVVDGIAGRATLGKLGL